MQMTLYERMRLLAAQYDCLNTEFHELNRELRQLVIEARIEKDSYTKAFQKFAKFMTFHKPPFNN